MMRCLFFVFIFLISGLVSAQNLLEERIWKISPRKKSIFLDSGVFHHGGTGPSEITGLRSSPGPDRGFERVVIDFNTKVVPRLYGHISSAQNKISVDFFETAITVGQKQLKNSSHVKSIDFVNVDGKSITMNIALKGKSTFDIFYLEQPGRLVIDIR